MKLFILIIIFALAQPASAAVDIEIRNTNKADVRTEVSSRASTSGGDSEARVTSRVEGTINGVDIEPYHREVVTTDGEARITEEVPHDAGDDARVVTKLDLRATAGDSKADVRSEQDSTEIRAVGVDGLDSDEVEIENDETEEDIDTPTIQPSAVLASLVESLRTLWGIIF